MYSGNYLLFETEFIHTLSCKSKENIILYYLLLSSRGSGHKNVSGGARWILYMTRKTVSPDARADEVFQKDQ